MRTPLIRQGGGTAAVILIYENLSEERRALNRMIDTANATETQQEKRRRGLIAFRSAAGDEARLRAIPVCAKGVPGCIPGTAPHLTRI